MINLCMVDDHPIVRRGIAHLLAGHGDILLSGEAGSCDQALTLVRTLHPQVLLMNISMPGRSGLEALGRLLAAQPDLRVIFLSGQPEEQYALALLRQGAMAYLNKGCDPGDIVTAIRTVAQGRRYITARVGELLAMQMDGAGQGKPPHLLLSEREFQVFLRLSKGQSVGKIAQTLCLSVKSISTYRSRTLDKLSLSSNSDLTYYAMKNELIE